MTRPLYTLFAWLLLYLPSCCLLALHTNRGQHAPQVKTHGAAFIGKTDDYYGVSTWLGIRYAQPPIGSLRLQPPQKVDNDSTINATSFGAQCFQLSTPANATNNISEDCLYLNIYRPSDAALKEQCDDDEDRDEDSVSMPVLFFIHGGAFNDGSGERYDARSLVNTSVALRTPTIVVTINYRLSFFGFSAGTAAIANNALNLGLLDQRMALQWVHDNICFFGGDSKKVTLWGQSAGAASVGLQIVAYNGKHENLFRAAILESGSPQVRVPTPPATWPLYQQAWDMVIAGIGCNTSTNLTTTFHCVQSAPTPLLFTTIFLVGRQLSILPQATAPWEPVFDPTSPPKPETFLSTFPTALLASHSFVKLPIIAGFTTDELTYLIPTVLNIDSDVVLTGVAQAVLSFVPLPIIEELLALDSLAEYPNPTYRNNTSLPELANAGQEWKRATAVASDLFERCPGLAFTHNMSLFAPVWKYLWNAALPSQLAQVPEMGVVHGSELAYVFGRSYTAGNPYVFGFEGSYMPFPNDASDLELSLVVQKAWLSFARHLDPNQLGDLGGQDWPKYQIDSERVLVFQKPDGSGEFANGSFGVAVGQGLHLEKDSDDKPMCDFIIANDAAFVH